MTVVRNQAYSRSSLGVRERHNERKNESYYNSDIIPERADLNVHFKQCEGTYEQAFDALLAAGEISTRGQKADAKIVDEMVFDVNTEYFEEHGSLEFAKKFYESAYQLAVKEAGGEEYILSAVMHADEKNTTLSAQLGHDVFHYHLHVIYVPVVEKEIRWSKRCKDVELVGKVKEVITQVSHSKKWPRFKDNDHWINSYSLLQDRFFEHMKEVGFDGFERGERGSTTEHLEVLDYKSQQDEKRLATLDRQAEKKEERIEKLDEKIAVKKQTAHTFSDIEAMAKPTLGGRLSLSIVDWKAVAALAKKGVVADAKISDWKRKAEQAKREGEIWKARYEKSLAPKPEPPILQPPVLEKQKTQSRRNERP